MVILGNLSDSKIIELLYGLYRRQKGVDHVVTQRRVVRTTEKDMLDEVRTTEGK